MLAFSKCLRSVVFWTAIGAVATVAAVVFPSLKRVNVEIEAREGYIDVLLFDKATGAALRPDDIDVVTEHDRAVPVSASGVISEKRKDLPWISIRDRKTSRELCFKNIPENAVSPFRLDIERK